MNLGPSKSLVFPEHEKMPGVRCPGAGASTFGLPREGKLHRCPSCATPFQCIAPPRQTKLQERRATSRQIVRDAGKEVAAHRAAAKAGIEALRAIGFGLVDAASVKTYAMAKAEEIDQFLTRKQKG